PATADELLVLVQRSGLVPEDLLRRCLDRLPAEIRSAAPATLAPVLVREGLLTSYQAQQLLQGKARGFLIGKYKILDRLGSGGMALVYLCEDTATQRRVAVKVLPTSCARDTEFLKRFAREGRVAAGLDHPHIVRTFELGQDGKVHFLVMEYI